MKTVCNLNANPNPRQIKAILYLPFIKNNSENIINELYIESACPQKAEFKNTVGRKSTLAYTSEKINNLFLFLNSITSRPQPIASI